MEITIQRSIFHGRDSLEMRTPASRLVVVIDSGPRVAFFGKADGRNLLFWDGEEKLRRGDWLLRGGHRLWTTRPWADESEETYATDNVPVTYELTDNSICVTARGHEHTGLQKQLRITCEESSQFLIENSITNLSDMLWSGGIWSLTATDPGIDATYGIPLGDGSNWDLVRIVIPRRWGGMHTAPVNDPQVSITENCMIIHPQGTESKRMVYAPQGIIGMTDRAENLTFLKRTDFHPAATYPESTNIACYIAPGNTFVEMEFMGPQQVLKPGGELRLAEHWSLTHPVEWNGSGANHGDTETRSSHGV